MTDWHAYFLAKGITNVPERVITRLEAESKAIVEGANIVAADNNEINLQPDSDEINEELAGIYTNAMNNTILYIHKTYTTMVGLGAEGLLSIGLTDEQWKQLFIYVSYFNGKDGIKKDMTEWLAHRCHPAFTDFNREVRFFRLDPPTTETTT